MSYKFKYHPDNVIYKNGAFYKSYVDFMAENPGFPLVEGKFFEYKLDGLFELIINNNDSFHHQIQQDLTDYQDLITAINLGE